MKKKKVYLNVGRTIKLLLSVYHRIIHPDQSSLNKLNLLLYKGLKRIENTSCVIHDRQRGK